MEDVTLENKISVVPVAKVRTSLTSSGDVESSIEDLEKEYLPLVQVDISDKENYELVRVACGKLRKLRTSVDKRRLNISLPARDYVKHVNDSAKEIIERIKKIEEPLAKKKKEFDATQERIKREKALAEEKRIDTINERITNVSGIAGKLITADSSVVKTSIDELEADDMTWAEEFMVNATRAKAMALESLKALLAQKVAAENAEREKAEREAAQEKERAEKEAAKKEEEERLAKERAEENRVRTIKEKIEGISKIPGSFISATSSAIKGEIDRLELADMTWADEFSSQAKGAVENTIKSLRELLAQKEELEEAKRKAEAEEAKRKAEAEEAKRKAEAEEAKRKAEAEEAKRKAEAEEANKTQPEQIVDLYHELLGAVPDSCLAENETRHDAALRLIKMSVNRLGKVRDYVEKN